MRVWRCAVVALALVVGFSITSSAVGGPSPVTVAKKALKTSKKALKTSKKALKTSRNAVAQVGEVSDRVAANSAAIAAATECGSGLVKAGDVCYESANRTAANWLTALQTCAAAGRRLPSVGEAFGMVTAIGGAEVSNHWTDNEFRTGADAQAVTVVHKLAGVVQTNFSLKHFTETYRCVTSPGA
jgi:phage portal protein BeeE